jgi:hypothetical protein
MPSSLMPQKYSSNFTQELFDKFASMDMNDLMWNFSRHEDTLAGDMASAQEKVKGKMAVRIEVKIDFE